ncbi:UNKNOWN [Stylonychia lemnae]|uniref:Uncharacterized protein n=1 Tax=Stylonychia lemnae TaxID=5949 RepID=A0A078B739_STYLE|nr:UNKNOWN [Stylonychia lemnae]|eukprot:CDW90214.1 UNKNOWN [Stylonychia lemnae]
MWITVIFLTLAIQQIDSKQQQQGPLDSNYNYSEIKKSHPRQREFSKSMLQIQLDGETVIEHYATKIDTTTTQAPREQKARTLQTIYNDTTGYIIYSGGTTSRVTLRGIQTTTKKTNTTTTKQTSTTTKKAYYRSRRSGTDIIILTSVLPALAPTLGMFLIFVGCCWCAMCRRVRFRNGIMQAQCICTNCKRKKPRYQREASAYKKAIDRGVVSEPNTDIMRLVAQSQAQNQVIIQGPAFGAPNYFYPTVTGGAVINPNGQNVYGQPLGYNQNQVFPMAYGSQPILDPNQQMALQQQHQMQMNNQAFGYQVNPVQYPIINNTNEGVSQNTLQTYPDQNISQIGLISNQIGQNQPQNDLSVIYDQNQNFNLEQKKQ